MMEQNVGRQRAARVDRLGAKPLYGRRYEVAILLAECALFAGVRV